MKTRIICAGTFDLLHTGHIKYLKEAKKLAKNSELIVIVARDDNSKRIKKKQTVHDENIRLKLISDLDFVDQAVLGFKSGKIIDRVVSLNPDIIALGHDQWAKEEWLNNELKKQCLNVKIVRMKKFPKKYL
ncbi:FAD synthase [Candidatus Woesearchaeota archaeon]|jgi:FAD synthetase|nr:FAD synthase [Candidatus Woesearchaeota archaeon]MBT6045147.1 FAD synthase [Candidatus Woesearchaeota archaeon]